MARSRKSKNLDRWVRRNQSKHFCRCSCGETIIVLREHHKKSVGIPQFIRGHNLQKSEGFSSDVLPEKKGMWDNLSPEEQQRRISQLKSFGRREANPAWKGGRRIDENGYVHILMPEHPFAKDGYIAEHRLVVEARTREYDPDSPLLVEVEDQKYLSPATVVHHIDEVTANNDPGSGPKDIGNLMLLPNQAAHAFLHKSPLPMDERLRRIAVGVYHSRPVAEEDA